MIYRGGSIGSRFYLSGILVLKNVFSRMPSSEDTRADQIQIENVVTQELEDFVELHAQQTIFVLVQER